MKYFFVFFLCLFFWFPMQTTAQQATEISARVIHVLEEQDESGQIYTIIQAQDTHGQLYRIDSREDYLQGDFRYKVQEGQNILLQVVQQDGNKRVFLIDVVRTNRLLWIFLLFAIITVIIGKLRGLFALGGLVVTLGILFGLVLPGILAGYDPILVTTLGSLIILFVNMHISHGFSKSTFVAFLSTAVGLGLVLIFAKLFVMIAQLSGLASEEASLLYLKTTQLAVPSGLLLAGIILGATGVLDDIAITQMETVSELKTANQHLPKKQLFKQAMRIGRHHIASVVNTLVLAYAGVALPLFLLFLVSQQITIFRFINEEVVAEEIVRTLSGTLALVLLVPISTWFAILIQTEKLPMSDHQKE